MLTPISGWAIARKPKPLYMRFPIMPAHCCAGRKSKARKARHLNMSATCRTIGAALSSYALSAISWSSNAAIPCICVTF